MKSISTSKLSKQKSSSIKLRKLFVLFLLLTGSIIILSPLFWMISTSLKSPAEIAQYPPSLIPKEFHFSNYIEAWKTAAFTRWTMNTLFIAVFVMIGNVLVNSLIAYGFAKIPFKGKNILFVLVISTMLIPGFVTLVPQYILFSKLGWLNTYLPLIVPAFLGSTFFIFLLRQFTASIPDELIEAAMLDGASHLQIWWKIILPLTRPALITVAIFSFNGAWNDLLGPLLYINDENLYTLQIGLTTFKGTVQTQWHYLMSMSVMVLLPVLLLFFFFQRYFIEGSNISSSRKG
ncbi:sugar ABC transporter permease [Niallia circulans]|uniref:carbohydrate ABC transporter permease n=1 Tax=Niallia circulans TaxID=1397 RepID=UPI00077CD6EC|nr:carbohydrate ABC transporter permease [Niallia circulans]MDR4315930.1 carbohydrate ABC transporter permease [Niallia circulans]MED3841258.1 carbohydrate ABC transporter permease [Niallia circulans]MED4244810.1 carbohydrate ABC transporter permease [Niallia circulans]MED4249707.1 carbohydrate ABC transporter permease [Niallia circulans]QKH60393.1 carbohydrate ABC transporter permease [Niallia circulans]